MSILQVQDGIGACIAGIDKIKQARSNPRAINSQSTFNDLLRNSLQETGASTSSEAALPALTKDQVTLLVKIIQTQMNRQLFNVVFNDSAAINYFPSRMLPVNTEKMPSSPTEVSKNGQVPPKNDVTQTKDVSQTNSNFDPIIEKAARKYEIDPDLINFNGERSIPAVVYREIREIYSQVKDEAKILTVEVKDPRVLEAIAAVLEVDIRSIDNTLELNFPSGE